MTPSDRGNLNHPLGPLNSVPWNADGGRVINNLADLTDCNMVKTSGSSKVGDAMLHATASIPGCYRRVSARAAATRYFWKRDFPNKLASAA